MASWFTNPQRTWQGLEEYLRFGGELEGQGAAMAYVGDEDEDGEPPPGMLDFNVTFDIDWRDMDEVTREANPVQGGGRFGERGMYLLTNFRRDWDAEWDDPVLSPPRGAGRRDPCCMGGWSAKHFGDHASVRGQHKLTKLKILF
eukprot:1083763-Amphidinium_carterae.1